MTRTAFITGATSGFGAAAARTFVADGWRVIATGRRAERLQALADELGAQHVHAAPFDMRDEAAMRAALAALPPEFRDIDLQNVRIVSIDQTCWSTTPVSPRARSPRNTPVWRTGAR